MYKRVIIDLQTAIRDRKGGYITLTCNHCGKDFKTEQSKVWAKYCDRKCYKEALEEKKRINRIMNA